jgi:hypothetical protein
MRKVTVKVWCPVREFEIDAQELNEGTELLEQQLATLRDLLDRLERRADEEGLPDHIRDRLCDYGLSIVATASKSRRSS